jgi:hypothetical protein
MRERKLFVCLIETLEIIVPIFFFERGQLRSTHCFHSLIHAVAYKLQKGITEALRGFPRNAIEDRSSIYTASSAAVAILTVAGDETTWDGEVRASCDEEDKPL